MSEVIDDDPSVNPVIQEGGRPIRGIRDTETGEFLVRFEALSESTTEDSEDDDEFHSPIKEPRIAPPPITTRDTATTQTPATATIVAARTETIAAATTTESPIAATTAQASTAEDETPEDPSTPSPRGSQKRSAQPSSKSKQKKKLRRDAQCRKGARVKVTRNTLYHVLKDDAQKESTKQYGNHRNFFGTIASGSGKQGYKIQFDDLPVGNQEVMVRRRNMIKVVLENEEEAEFDHATDLAEAYADVTPRVTRKDPLKASADDFCGLDKESLREAATYEMRYGKEEGDIIVWKILQDSDSIDLGMPDMDGDSRFKRNIDLNEDTDLGDVFFAEFFPSIIGHAKLIDEYHADPRSAYYSTTINDNIIFHDENAQDPDWKVQQAYLLLIAAASEVENGIENLWKRGKSTGRHDYPNFGQFMPINYFKAFVAAAAYCWADRKFWYIDKRDRSWDIFLPCLKEYNERRKRLIHSICLILDESMSGWRPKTSKLGGLPNYTFEPRKPVPLGTMFRNRMCCLSGIFAYQDVVMNPEMQAS